MFLCDTHPTQKSYTLLSVIEQITQVVCIQKILFTICIYTIIIFCCVYFCCVVNDYLFFWRKVIKMFVWYILLCLKVPIWGRGLSWRAFSPCWNNNIFLVGWVLQKICTSKGEQGGLRELNHYLFFATQPPFFTIHR